MLERDEARLREFKEHVRESVRESARRIARALHEKMVTGRMQHCGEQKYIVGVWVTRERGIEDECTVSEHLVELLESENGVRAKVIIDTELTLCEQLSLILIASIIAAIVAAIIPASIMSGATQDRTDILVFSCISAISAMFITYLLAATFGVYMLHDLLQTTRVSAKLTEVTYVRLKNEESGDLAV